ncbi:MAG: cadherin domain-containing protein [Flavobacteriaceae bacterium]
MKNSIKLINLLIIALFLSSCNNDDNNTQIITLEDLQVTIDENPTNGQVVGTVQSDSNSNLTYSITSQTPNGALSIDESTGELTVADATLFDYEINTEITAIVSAIEASNTALVTINLNNLEVMLQDLAVSIDENPTTGQVLGTIVSNGTATNYSLISQTPNGALSIDANSGELTVADEALFDFETNPVITASVSDGEATNPAMVTISLTNINEVMIFTFDESIDENPTNGQVIGTLQSNAVGNPNYSIVSQTPAGAISIDPVTGVVTVADAALFDHEVNQGVDAIISADDAMNTDDFEIQIDNVNEIGDYNYGGVIFWINAAGDEGYVVALEDQSSGAPWGCYGLNIPFAVGPAIGDGEVNTMAILSSCTDSGIAADLANDAINGFNDWFLPSVAELNEVYNNKATLNASIIANGGTAFSNNWYWTSTQQGGNANNAYFQFFGNGTQTLNSKANMAIVRAIRHWTDF